MGGELWRVQDERLRICPQEHARGSRRSQERCQHPVTGNGSDGI